KSDFAGERLHGPSQGDGLELQVEAGACLPRAPVRVESPHDAVIVIGLQEIRATGHAAVGLANLAGLQVDTQSGGPGEAGAGGVVDPSFDPERIVVREERGEAERALKP